jgi:hypothetical protein
MNTLRRSVIMPSTTAYGLALVCGLLFLCTMMGACNRSQRTDTLRASIVSVNAARDGFLQWDRAHQASIVGAATSRETGEQALASYRHEREPIVNGFSVAYRALALAATQSDDPSLKAALAEAGELVDAVQAMIRGGAL